MSPVTVRHVLVMVKQLSPTPTPACKKECIPEYTTNTYIADKKFGSGNEGYQVPGKPSMIQQEIIKNGPVEAAFEVYEDFPT